MTEKNLPRRDPIVARRELDLGNQELDEGLSGDRARGDRAHGDSLRGQNNRPGNANLQPGKQSNALMMVIVLLLIICLAGLGWFSWQQSQAQALLQQRFDDLAAKIDSTDESLSQSGAALSVRLSDQQEELDKHWSEIKKLWGVANDRNKKAIKTLEQAVSDGSKNHGGLAKKVSALDIDQKGMMATLSEFGGNSLATVARIDEVDERVENVSGSQDELRQSIDRQQRSLESRLLLTEKAIESIDAFRRQTNQSLESLRRAPSAP